MASQFSQFSFQPVEIPEEEPDEVDPSHVTLDKYLCDLNLIVNKVCTVY